MNPQPLFRRKFTVLILALLALLPAAAVADDTYTASLSGVECNACKRTISKSLGKLKGVKIIRIAKDKKGVHRMTVTTDGSAPITRAQAEKALEKAEHYRILSWKKAD